MYELINDSFIDDVLRDNEHQLNLLFNNSFDFIALLAIQFVRVKNVFILYCTLVNIDFSLFEAFYC